MTRLTEYKRVHGELVKIKDRNHIYNNLEEFMTNVLTFMRYVDMMYAEVDRTERIYTENRINPQETYIEIERVRYSIINKFNELSPWGMDHLDIVETDYNLYQRGYYFPTPNNHYPAFDCSYEERYKNRTSRLHAINIGIQIWNCEIEENEEREEYISYSLWKYLEQVKQGDLIEYRGYYMQVKHFTKQ